MAQLAGESKAASDNLSAESREEGDESSSVFGRYTHRFSPSANFAFLHLLPIFHLKISSLKPRTQNLCFEPQLKKFKREHRKTKNLSKIHKTQISKCLN
ncbi:hypothetical protein PRUPE_2G212100 [Prunus persica]|uniref:Uncharacterized protein n=1 Tax=Prunus persica TaxID=3760 RepID=M5XEB0_PRUPE|nr:hypothetical protein PRUPE_2G212100 [Prunus persica]